MRCCCRERFKQENKRKPVITKGIEEEEEEEESVCRVKERKRDKKKKVQFKNLSHATNALALYEKNAGNCS